MTQLQHPQLCIICTTSPLCTGPAQQFADGAGPAELDTSFDMWGRRTAGRHLVSGRAMHALQWASEADTQLHESA
jgi:hypothetical protein